MRRVSGNLNLPQNPSNGIVSVRFEVIVLSGIAKLPNNAHEVHNNNTVNKRDLQRFVSGTNL